MKNNLRIVLVRPRNPGNIGACARAMGNFGVEDLVVVDPYAPIWKETRSAPDAEPIVLKAKVVKTFQQAVKGCSQVLGTSSFAHTRFEQLIVPLPSFHPYLRDHSTNGRVALVFGSERSGLSKAELAVCEAVIQIPMARPGVSMNLAQAVAVVLYEWSRARPPRPAPRLAAIKDKEVIINCWIRLAGYTGYPPGYTEAARAGRIRKALQQAQWTEDTSHFLKSFSRWLEKSLKRSLYERDVH